MVLAAGSLLGTYEIQTRLGAPSGQGEVYRARDTRLKREVAIKVLRAEAHHDQRARAKLLDEARLAATLNHPNVCTVYEVGESQGHVYLAMELIEGRTLSELLAERPGGLATESVIRYGTQIASALAHAHEHRVIHRDIKGPNVMVLPDGRVKVLDFGVARRAWEGADGAAPPGTLTEAGTIVGTPHYMAPEVLRGAKADERSDLWALGVLLQEMASGELPFRGATVYELTHAVWNTTPAPLPARVPAGLQGCVRRCLAKEPGERYGRASEVRAALEALEAGGLEPSRTSARDEEIQGEWSIALPPAFANLESSTVQLVGRDPDLAALAAAAERARAGRRQFVFVAGEAGIGKTRLISEFARSVASSDAIVLLGRCDAEALTPYQPLVQALEWYVRGCPTGVLHRQLDRVEATSELAQLIPSISGRVVSPVGSPESNVEGRRYRLFEAISSFLAAASQTRPVIIVFEDVHWADRPTLLMLRHVLRSSHESRVLLVATYRETELDRTHPLGELLSDLRREPSTTILKLRTLNDAEIAKFVGGWLGRAAVPSLVRLVAGNTEGNPLFMREVLRHLEETGNLANVQSGGLQVRQMGLPEGVREVIGRRVARLTEDCRRVLAMAAVVGRDFAFPVLQAVSDLTEDRLLDVLDEAQGARLIEEAPGITDGYTFSHALIRETLYGELTTARRVRHHQRVAEALERGMKPGQEPLADLAYHYAQAASRGDVEKAVSFAVRAAEAAAARFAVDEAARFYGMALQALSFLPDDAAVRTRRLELHVKSASALGSIGQWPQARAQYEAALTLVGEENERRAELLVRCAEAAFWALDIPGTRRLADDAIRIAKAIGRDDLRADAMACLGAAGSSDGNVLEVIELDREAIELAGGGTWGVRTLAMARSSISLYHAGLTEESILRSSQAMASARAKDDPALLVYALSQYGLACTGAGRYQDAQRAFDEARVVGRRHGILPFLARSIAMSAGMRSALGDFAAAESLANESRDLSRQLAFAPALISSGMDLLFIYTRSGELGRAEGMLDEVGQAVRSAHGWHGWLWGIRLNQVLAEIALARGDWRKAEEAADSGIAQSRARHRVKYEARGLITRACARKHLGDMASAIQDAASAVEIARRLGDPPVLIDALAVHLDVDGNDMLLAEARSAIDRVLQALPDEQLRKLFLASGNVHRIKP